jgi:alkylation response protein AidB-like acyl-CoA dehydrogenase
MKPGEGEELKAKLPPRVGGELAQSLAFRGAMPVRPAELLSLVVMLISLGLVARALLRRGTDSQTRLFLAIILIGIAADIAVCGAMSTPHNRYSMRVLWLLPLGAFLTMITQLVDRQGQRLETNSD